MRASTVQASVRRKSLLRRLHLPAMSDFTHNKIVRIRLCSGELIKSRLRDAMARQKFSEDLKAFIKEQVQTVSRLEVLLLLHREPSRSFTAVDVAVELGFEKKVAQEQLRSLAALDLLVQANTDEAKYSYHPTNVRSWSMVDELAITYSKRPVPILSLILNECVDRTRVFAEAFRSIKGTD